MIYAGKESQAPALVDVSRVVFETFELLKLSVSKGVTFVTDLDSKSPPVWASPAEIRQIVMNLVTNASDAIGNRHGVIRVTTHHVDRDDAQTTGKGLEDNHHMLLEVSDTGSGMPREMQTRVFDPFFSTRGAGHGLGLAVVHGIVRSLNGVIDFVSEPGHGTTFQIWLPCAENTADATGDHTAGEPSVRSSQFVVLVVEDEAPLRQAVIGMLRRAGFSVLGAADGTSAIELLRANSGKIDVILLDMTIPGASSNDVLAEAAQTRPGIRVILTSAYSKEMLMPLLSASQIHGFIRKPYRLLDVVQTLKKAASA
jgi:CheY-like chemotaxis protein